MLLALTVIFFQCGCPPDFKLGDLYLQTPHFFSLKGSEKFTFVNQSGEELVFDKGFNNGQANAPLVMSTLCNEGMIDTQIAYYKTEGFSVNYRLNYADGIQYHSLIQNEVVNPTSPADTILYETFRIGLPYSTEGESKYYTSFFYIVSDRGNAISSAITQNNNSIRIIADTTLNGNQYTNLYCQKESPGLFYSTAYGVVLFYYNGDWWYLKK